MILRTEGTLTTFSDEVVPPIDKLRYNLNLHHSEPRKDLNNDVETGFLEYPMQSLHAGTLKVDRARKHATYVSSAAG